MCVPHVMALNIYIPILDVSCNNIISIPNGGSLNESESTTYLGYYLSSCEKNVFIGDINRSYNYKEN